MSGARLSSIPEGYWACGCGYAWPMHQTSCLRCGAGGPHTPPQPAIPGHFEGVRLPGHGEALETAGKPAKKRGATRPLNKTEERFMVDVLGKLPGAVSIHPQALILDFGDGTSYRPDFATVDASGVISVWEVKGGHVGKVAWSRHGIERFKRAKEKWRHIRFVLAKWTGRKWEMEA